MRGYSPRSYPPNCDENTHLNCLTMADQDETASSNTPDQPGKSDNEGNGAEEVHEAADGEDGDISNGKSANAEKPQNTDISVSNREKDDVPREMGDQHALNADKSPILTSMYPYPTYPPYPYPPHFAMQPPGSVIGSNPMTSPANPHEYTDVSTMSDPAPDNRNRGGVSEIFPIKLHKMLEHTEAEGLTDVVSFFSHGRAFAIHKPRRFVSEIMPKFFRQSRFTSFQRQLNLYGFKRITQGRDNGGYYHELFLKGRPGLCVNMKRTRIKGSAKQQTNPDTEPNFYNFPPISQGGQSAGPGQSISTSESSGHQLQASPPSAPVASSPTSMYPGYMYPAPPYAPVPPSSGPYGPAQSHRGGPIPPYTAAQQKKKAAPVPSATPIYPYPMPFYSYPWYPPPGQAHSYPAAQSPGKDLGISSADVTDLSPASESQDSPNKVKNETAV